MTARLYFVCAKGRAARGRFIQRNSVEEECQTEAEADERLARMGKHRQGLWKLEVVVNSPLQRELARIERERRG